MAAKKTVKERTVPEVVDRPQVWDAVGRSVLRELGEPTGGHRVDVRELWADHYRVNVFVGAEFWSMRLAHSYFLVTDPDGNIIEASPRITQQYGSRVK
jgi:hypothetical protein